MHLDKLQLTDFRNYADLTAEFSPQTNVLLGQNAQGKTNLLEAIYLLAMTRSHRTANDRQLIRFGQKSAQIEGVVNRKLGPLRLSISLGPTGKRVRVNQLEQAKLSQYIGQMNVILFAPEDLALVKGAPAIRRRFVDMEFGQIDARYLAALSQYRTVLRQRNQYLKQLQLNQARDEVYLDVLSAQLAELGGIIIAKRVKYLTQLEQYAQELQHEITQGDEQLTIRYHARLLKEIGATAEEVGEQLTTKYQEIRLTEVEKGTTLAGPHLDDVYFYLNGKNVPSYGSQGQQRTTALAVKLAEIGLMQEATGEAPILLLDDVLSELDGMRQTHLLRAIQDRVQTFLTSPALSDVARKLINAPRIFAVSAGTITPTENISPEIPDSKTTTD